MLVGAVTGTLKGDASSWVAATSRGAAALGNVKQHANDLSAALGKTRIESDGLTKALERTTYAAKQSEAAARALGATKGGLAGSFKTAGSEATRFAGAIGMMSGAMGAAGGETQKWAASLGSAAMMIGSGGPVGIALAVASAALALMNSEIEKQKDLLAELDKQWEAMTRDATKMRDAAEGSATDTKRDLATMGSTGNAGTTKEMDEITRRRATIGWSIVDAETKLTAAKAEQLRLQGEIGKLTGEALTKGQNDLDAATAKVALLTQTKKFKQEEFDLVPKLVAEEARLQKVAEARAEAEANIKAALRDQLDRFREMVSLASHLGQIGGREAVGAALSIVPGTLGGAFAGLGVNRHADGVIDAINGTEGRSEEDRRAREAIEITRLRREAAEQGMALENLLMGAARDRAEAERDLAQTLAMQQAWVERGMMTRVSEAFAPDLAGMAGATTQGKGGAALLGFAGGAVGGLASMAMGDPTGVIGSALGAGLGEMLGGLIDELAPLQEAGAIFVDSLAIIASALEPLFEPLITLAQVFRLTAELAAPFFEGFALFGSLIEVGARLAGAMVPLAAAFLTLYPPVLLLGAAVPGLTAMINEHLVPSMGGFYDAMVQVSIALIDFVNDLTGNHIKSLVAMESTLRSMASFQDMVNEGRLNEFTPEQAPGDKKDALRDFQESLKDGVKEGTVEGLEAFNRNVRNLPGYKDLPGAEFAASAGGEARVTIGTLIMNVQQPMTMNEVAKRAQDYARHGSIIAQSSHRGGNGPRRN